MTGSGRMCGFVVVVWGCRTRTASASLCCCRGGEQGRAELIPWPGQWRGRGLGLRLGQGQGGWSLCSRGDIGGRGRGGGGAGTTLCAAAIYGRKKEMIVYTKGHYKANFTLLNLKCAGYERFRKSTSKCVFSLWRSAQLHFKN